MCYVYSPKHVQNRAANRVGEHDRPSLDTTDETGGFLSSRDGLDAITSTVTEHDRLYFVDRPLAVGCGDRVASILVDGVSLPHAFVFAGQFPIAIL